MGARGTLRPFRYTHTAIGDLTPSLLTPEDVTARASWARIYAAGGRRIHHAHAGRFDLTVGVNG